jgi:hypothetical protein
MSYFVVDVESDGPVPPIYSMVCFGAIRVDEKLNRIFYGQTKPISKKWEKEALEISGFTREQHLTFNEPRNIMVNFANWIASNSVGRPTMISDNIAYDWQWINYYFHYYLGHNPFGFSGRRIGDLYCGMVKDTHAPWKRKLRKTKHTHNPCDDAKGNAEAILAMRDMGLKIKLV